MLLEKRGGLVIDRRVVTWVVDNQERTCKAWLEMIEWEMGLGGTGKNEEVQYDQIGGCVFLRDRVKYS